MKFVENRSDTTTDSGITPDTTAGTSKRASRIGWSSLAIALVLALTACGPGSSTPPPVTLTQLSLSFSGGPVTPTGTAESRSVTVTIIDAQGSTVLFDDDNRMSAGGKRSELEKLRTEQSLILYLAQDSRFDIVTRGYDRADNLVSYGEANDVPTFTSSTARSVQLTSVLGVALLAPRLPTNFVIPGQELDVMLSVSPDARPDLLATPIDFDTTYAVGNAAALAATDKGLRLRVGDRGGGDVSVTATVSGFLPAPDAVIKGDIEATINLPFAGTVAADTEPPVISDLAFDAVQQIFTGVTSDNFAVAHVTLWDGPVLLATTDLDEAARFNLPEIVFPGGGTAFLTYVALPSGS